MSATLTETPIRYAMEGLTVEDFEATGYVYLSFRKSRRNARVLPSNVQSYFSFNLRGGLIYAVHPDDLKRALAHKGFAKLRANKEDIGKCWNLR